MRFNRFIYPHPSRDPTVRVGRHLYLHREQRRVRVNQAVNKCPLCRIHQLIPPPILDFRYKQTETLANKQFKQKNLRRAPCYDTVYDQPGPPPKLARKPETKKNVTSQHRSAITYSVSK